MTELKALIGTFDLDPNRVVDLVLDAWEQQPNNSTWLKVLEPLHKDAPLHVGGAVSFPTFGPWAFLICLLPALYQLLPRIG